jgi:hypothetical protein
MVLVAERSNNMVLASSWLLVRASYCFSSWWKAERQAGTRWVDLL